jgi:transcriptional regulator GlxA family with amidase domain
MDAGTNEEPWVMAGRTPRRTKEARPRRQSTVFGAGRLAPWPASGRSAGEPKAGPAAPGAQRIDIIVHPGSLSLEASGAISVFACANRIIERRGRPRRYDVEVVAAARSSVPSDIGVGLKPTRALKRRDPPHTAIIVGTCDIDEALDGGEKITTWCQWAAPRVKRMVGLCSGCFFLAEAGLLDGKKATTHWSLADRLRRNYPRVELDEASLFTSAGNLWTSAGASAAVDLALALVEEDCGRGVAADVARELVIFSKRPVASTHAHVVARDEATPAAGIGEAQAWIKENLQRKISVGELANRARMSVRHFTRLFRTATGVTPGRFIEGARLDKALRLLESSLPLKTIAFHCGFASDEHLRKVFKKRLAMTAREYRMKRLAGGKRGGRLAPAAAGAEKSSRDQR